MTPHQTAAPCERSTPRRRRRAGARARELSLTLAAVLPALLVLHAPQAHADDNNSPPVMMTIASAVLPTASPSVLPMASPSPAVPLPAKSATQGAGNTAGANAVTPPAAARATPGTSRQVRFGEARLYRILIPSPMLEAQAAAEYAEIVRGAAHSERLYPDSDPHVQRVRFMVDRLAPYAQKWSDRVKNWKWEAAVVRSPDIRMYCLPGGKIVVYGGLLDRVKLNDHEFGMLLGHEIAHALREHVRERLGAQQAAQIEAGTVPQLFGLADLGVFPLGVGSQLVEMRYGRADETEADVIGSDIASRAGFDPRAALTGWDKLGLATKSDRGDGFVYVHPYTNARRADLYKRLPDMMPLYAKSIGMPLNTVPDYAGIPVPQRRKLVEP
ncbi:M48 family metallopeptidase [Paraburkholderia adhaesiva]|uniref:M48 family metallopeptidase n=1 Tax=Paraburkholderia adhaesiva TaxID=2883244 RepID=UPI001F2AE35E|nr:M48 family metallopeptidase [Paraburkholderia adhaesiva]